jgi:hypothetical protein
MNVWVVRFGALVGAIVVSLGVFYFWGIFGAALKTAMAVPVVSSHASQSTPSQSAGEVSVSIAKAPKHCPKGQTCR